MKIILSAVAVVVCWFLIWFGSTVLHPFADKYGTGLGLDLVCGLSCIAVLLAAVLNNIPKD